ncbi:MAG: hypothetical protein K8S16_06310 [Bacteroidales bacterium]|nr:hypothetical protein [Bacteroidales bacterium]
MNKKTKILNFTKQAILSTLLLVIFFSCTKDEETEEPQVFKPVIELISPGGPDVTVEPYEKVALSLGVTAGVGSSEKLTHFRFTKQFELEALVVVMDTVLDATAFQLTNFEHRVNIENGIEVWTFEATDKSGDVATKTLMFTIDGPPPDLLPTITLLSGIHPGTGWTYVDGDVTLEVSEPFVFGFTATSNTDENLANIKVTRNYENVSLNTILDSNINVSSYSVDIETIAYPGTPGTEIFTISATDMLDNSNSIEFSVTTTPQDPGISIHTNIVLGSYTCSTNKLFASETGETFSLTEAEDPAVQSKIDWVYFHGATYGHTLMSPENTDLYAVYPQIENWTNKNNTLFGKTTLGSSEYNVVTNNTLLILQIQNSGVTLAENYFSELMSNPGGFEVGDVLAFETQGGKRGLILITEVNPGTTNGESTIKFNVKVVK